MRWFRHVLKIGLPSKVLGKGSGPRSAAGNNRMFCVSEPARWRLSMGRVRSGQSAYVPVLCAELAKTLDNPYVQRRIRVAPAVAVRSRANVHGWSSATKKLASNWVCAGMPAT